MLIIDSTNILFAAQPIQPTRPLPKAQNATNHGCLEKSHSFVWFGRESQPLQSELSISVADWLFHLFPLGRVRVK